MKPIIFLDMDGVIANWHSAVFSLFGQSFRDYLDKNEFPLEYAIHKWLNITEVELWDRVDEASEDMGWWTTIPLFPWSQELVESLLKRDAELLISTTPAYTGHELSYSQKIKWLKIHFPDLSNIHKRVMLGGRKELLAAKNRILIDDCDSNIESFIEHYGWGVTFPQPWNSAYDQRTQRLSGVLDTVDRHLHAIKYNTVR